MPRPKMHPDQIDTSVALVRGLLRAQHPNPYYRETNPSFAELSRRTLDKVLADSRS